MRPQSTQNFTFPFPGTQFGQVRNPTLIMRRRFAVIVVAVAAFFPGAGEAQSKPGSFCWPMHYAGIVPGISQEKHVVRLLGQGAHRTQVGDGVRYYIDPAGTMTMQVAFVTDRVVGEISLESGIARTLSKSERARAVSKHLDSKEGFGNWHALRLGSTRQEVERNLGRPAKKSGLNEWVYNAECACEIPEYLTIFFVQGSVQRVVFSAPAG